jgi:hypothetical protein
MTTQRRGVVPSLLMIAGGALKIPLWVLFISLHGPTSFMENGRFLGGDAVIWGAIMSGVPSLLVAAGLIGHARVLGAPVARRVGWVLALVALLLPAVVDLSTRALWPPLLLPILAAGVIVMGVTGSREPALGRLSAGALVVIGVLLAAVFAYMLLLPLEVFDAIEGYRLQGLVEHVAVGAGWALVGIGLLIRPRPVPPAGDTPIP